MRITMLVVALLSCLPIAPDLLAKDRDQDFPPNIKSRDFVERLLTGGSPLINGNWVTFIYRGEAKGVELVGEMTGWGRGIKMNKLRGQPVHYLSLQFPPDAR